MAAVPPSRAASIRAPVGLLVLGLAAPAVALEPRKAITQYSHVVWQEKNGLPSDMVSAILQTRDGYLWFGTLNGLARFDGVRFTLFDPLRSDAPLLHRIYSLCEAGDGSLWVGSRGGLTRYRHGRFESYPMPEGFRQTGVRRVVEDAQGGLWARTVNELFRLEQGRLELVGRNVRSVERHPGGSLWVTTAEGIGRIEGRRIVLERSAPTVPGEPHPFALLSAVLEGNDGTLWFGAPWGLGRLTSAGQWTVLTSRDGLPATSVTALREDRHGTLWVGTTRGLVRFRRQQPAAERRHHPLGSQRIVTLYEDSEGSLWVGTDTGGVHQLRDGLFTPLATEDGLSDDLAMPIHETRDGSVWVGTARGLNRIRGGRIETYTTADGLSDEGVYALAEDASGRLFVGAGRGPITYFDGQRLRPFTARGLPPRLGRVTALETTSDGSLWIGTDAGGLFRVAGGAAERYTRENGLSDDHVARIHERPDGSVWVATDQGITVWRNGALTVYGTRDGLPALQVRAFHEAGETLWIGTYGGGLCRFRAGRFEALPAAGLPDTVIYEILPDGHGDLWMTSNRGVIRVAKGALERLAEGAPEPSAFTLYDVGDGLKSSTAVGNFQPAGWRSRDGRLWFPTRRGVVWVDPAHPVPSRQPPRPLIERVLLDGRPQPPGGSAVAPPGRVDLAIEYTAPSFRDPSRLRFRYRLDGLDSGWQDAGERRTAHYANVPPGRYTFRVAALTPDGRASPEEARFDVELQPHFYQTSLFYALCVAAAALLTWGAYHLKLRQVRNRFAAVLAERSRIAREMHDSLDQGFTAISLQLDVCARMAGGERATAPGPLRQRLELAQDLLEYARSEARRSVADLRSEALERGDLVTALSRVAEQFSVGSELRVEVAVEGRARPLPGAVENNLLRICQEAVTNAVRHGQAHEVAIGLAFEHEAVRLTVTDAGRGFDPAAVVSEREGHFGLMGIRERVKKLGGRLRLDSAPGEGTAVRVEIPVAE